MRTHLDLFSGVGGFALAARQAGFETSLFCEFEPFPRDVLRKNFPGVPIHDDIRTLTADIVRQHVPGRVHLITGGFPCQDISAAGHGGGISGERSRLWFEMLRVIRACMADWVVVENVPVLRVRGADIVLHGLEDAGYACWPLVVGADDAGAPHRRKRVFIVAHRMRVVGGAEQFGRTSGSANVADGDRQQLQRWGVRGELGGAAPACGIDGGKWERNGDAAGDCRQDASDAEGVGCQEGQLPERDTPPFAGFTGLGDAPHADSQPPDGTPVARTEHRDRQTQSGLGGDTDGLPAGLDGHQWPAGRGECQEAWEAPRTTEKGRHRARRLKALGNAVVPQVVYPILAAIRERLEI